jgi:predicted nucleic acid-binding protein
MKFVVDASVAVKWFIPEIHSAVSLRFLDPRIDLFAPDMIRAEIGNALWKRMRRRELTSAEAIQILESLETIGLDIRSSFVLLPSALALANALDRTVYDSVYLALAIKLDCALITADRKFHQAVVASAFFNHIRWIEEEPWASTEVH